jgi:nucleoside-diphosphate-sugar epimerase
MRVLLSGATGFVGANLQTYLRERAVEIMKLSRSATTGTDERDCIYWDQIEKIQLKDTDAIVHLAGKAHDVKNTSEPEEYFRVNTDLTGKLFQTFLESSARDFIFLSSVKAVADTLQGILYENTVPDPKTPYGQSKLKAENYILGNNVPADKRIFILRPCMIHGPGNKGNFNLLYRLIRKKIPYPLAAFENKRSFLSVDNLCFIIYQLLTNPSIPGGIYNVADDEPISTNQLIDLIGTETNVRPLQWKINKGVVGFFAKVGDKLRLPFNSEKLKKLTENYVVSNAKIKSALGIERLPITTTEGFRITLKSFSGE